MPVKLWTLRDGQSRIFKCFLLFCEGGVGKEGGKGPGVQGRAGQSNLIHIALNFHQQIP